MAETQMLQLLTRRNPTNDQACELIKQEMIANARRLGLVEVGDVFEILGVGIVTSACVIVIEILVTKARKACKGCRNVSNVQNNNNISNK